MARHDEKPAFFHTLWVSQWPMHDRFEQFSQGRFANRPYNGFSYFMSGAKAHE
jgi:hypothetical protein